MRHDHEKSLSNRLFSSNFYFRQGSMKNLVASFFVVPCCSCSSYTRGKLHSSSFFSEPFLWFVYFFFSLFTFTPMILIVYLARFVSLSLVSRIPPGCNKSLSCFENVSRGECFVFGLSFSLHMSVTLYVVLYKSRSLFRPLRHTAQIKNFLCGRFFSVGFHNGFAKVLLAVCRLFF